MRRMPVKFLRINWTHGREKAEELIRDRTLLHFMLSETGQKVEGYMLSIKGETHALVGINPNKKTKRAMKKACSTSTDTS
jgi:hypothetical protein